MKGLFLILVLLVSATLTAVERTELDDQRSALAQEAYNFLKGVNTDQLNTKQGLLFQEGMKRLENLTRELDFVPFVADEVFFTESSSTCLEFQKILLKRDAADKAMLKCQQREELECKLYSSQIVRNLGGGCQAEAVVHGLKKSDSL